MGLKIRAAAGLVAWLALGAATAGSASAEVLNLVEQEGIPVARHSFVLGDETTFTVGGTSCVQESVGTVEINGKENDRLHFEEPAHAECTEGSMTGGARTVWLSSSGVATLKMIPTLAITLAGPCVYDFGTLKGSFAESADVWITGTATGKRNKEASSSSCAKTYSAEFTAAEFGLDGYVFAAEYSA